MPPSFLWPKASVASPREDHVAAFEHGAFGDQDDGVAAGILAAVVDQQLGQLLDVEFVFGDDAAVGGSGHGGQHGGESGIASEDFEDEEALVGTGGGAQAVGHLDGAGDARAEADAVIGARDIVVHRLGDGDDLDAFLIEADAVAKCVVAADRDEVFDAKPLEILDDFRREVVLLGGVAGLEMRGDAALPTALGLVREVWRKVPPVRPARLTRSSVRNWKLSLLS